MTELTPNFTSVAPEDGVVLQTLEAAAFDPLAVEVGPVETATLGLMGWVRDGKRYKRGDRAVS